MTWALWRALNQPDRAHPLFQRIVHQPLNKELVPVSLPRLPRPLLILGEIVLMVLACPASLVLVVFAVAIFIVPGLVYFLNIYDGLVIALNVATEIAGIRERKQEDTLAVTPSGAMGTYWAVWAACLHRPTGPDQRAVIHHYLSYRTPFILIFLFNCAASLTPSVLLTGIPSPWAALAIAIPCALGVVFYIDFMQIVSLAGLVAALCATYAHDRVEAHLLTLGGFILLQLSSYLVTILLTGIVIPPIFAALGVTGVLTVMLGALAGVALFAGSRELGARVLWQRLAQVLEVDPLELDRAAGLKV